MFLSNSTCLATDGYPCYLRQYIQAKECGKGYPVLYKRANGVGQIYDLSRLLPSVDHIVVSQILH